MKALLGGVAVSCFWAITAHAAILNGFQNGGFENGSVDPGNGFVTINSPDTTSITGWSVDAGSVDYIGGYWMPHSGSRSIDMAGNSAGTLSQSFETTFGQEYKVTFWIAGNPDGDPTTKSLDVFVLGLTDPTYTFDATGKSRTNMGWVQHSLTFTGTGFDKLVFQQNDPTSPYGMALDDVAVTAVTGVPLPSSAPMFGAALVVLGAVGYGVARRKTSAAA